LLQTLKQLYSETRKLGIVPGANSTPVAGLVLAVDLVVSFSLFSAGFSVALSHTSGFLVAGFLLLLAYASGYEKPDVNISGNSSFQKAQSILIYSLVQLAIRAGSIASLVHFGLPDTAALVLGILAATFIGIYSSSLCSVADRF